MISIDAEHGQALDLKVWKFPCGEVGVQIGDIQYLDVTELVRIRLDFESNDDLMALAQIVDILRNASKDLSIILNIPYLPYSRQDRRVNGYTDSHALKVFGNFINSLNFTYVVTQDVHSSVAEAVIDRLYNKPQEKCAEGLPGMFDVFVAPDAGAEKKIFKLKQVKAGVEVLCAIKTRNSEGKVVDTRIPDDVKLDGKHVCVVDDLCDGGATFLALGAVLKAFNPASISLYVTHGMFTNPGKFQELREMYTEIFVHNLRNESCKPFVTII